MELFSIRIQRTFQLVSTPLVSRVRFLFFIPMGNTEFLNFFHISDSIRSCVQNYFFTPEIEIVKQLKNNEV